MFNLLARPSAGIGVVEVQKPIVFLRFLRCSRDPDRRGRGAKTRGMFNLLARPSAGIGVVEVFEVVFGSCLVVRAPAPGRRKTQLAF